MITTEKLLEDFREYLYGREDTLYGDQLTEMNLEEFCVNQGKIFQIEDMQEWLKTYEEKNNS